ncbi:MAG: hypothetical protein H0T47_12325 [Planctomycetaceae bacterium]|nr:hypothetical protein [Planctomycetaceae bacterium]
MLGLLVVLVSGAAPPPENNGGATGVEMNDLEQAFSEKMSNIVLTGRFTTDGRDGKTEPEKYHIVSATKTGKDQWLILAKISYGTKSQVPAIPIPVKVLWAGDTPMLSLTDLTIPGFGTFTSRVMFYGDRYAGTWQHDEVGGHLFGTLSKADDDEASPPETPEQNGAKADR